MAQKQDKIKVLYNELSGKYKLGTYDEFSVKLQDDTKRKAFYDGVSSDYNLGTYDDFSVKVKKKDVSESPSEDGSLDSAKTEDVNIGDSVGSSIATGLRSLGVPDMFSGFLSSAIARGAAAGAVTGETLKVMYGGKDVSDSDVDNFVTALKNSEQLGQSAAMTTFNKDYEASIAEDEDASEIWAFIKAAAKNPKAIPEVSLTSMAQMASGAFDSLDSMGIVAAGAGAGAATGAALGMLTGPLAPISSTIGAITGSIKGAMSAAGGLTETTASFNEFMKEELGDKDFTRENIKNILGNDEARQRIINRSLARGITILALDFVAAGASGAAVKGIKTVGTTGKALRAVAAVGAESVGGGLGEVGGRLAAGQEMDTREIMFEMAGEAPGAGISGPLGLIGTPRYKVNNGGITKNDLLKIINTSTDEQIIAMNVSIDNDEAMAAIYDTKVERAKIKQDIDPSITGDTNISAVVDLELEIKRLKNKNTESAKQKVSELKKKISDIRGTVDSETTQEVSDPLEVTQTVDAAIESKITDIYTTQEIDRVKTLSIEKEDGATMNLNGSKYEKGGLVIALASKNMPTNELTQEVIQAFIDENKEAIQFDNVKVGIYKFPNRDEVSIDINIVADRSLRAEALSIGKELGQEALYDLDSFENIKTGADGKNPKKLTTQEFIDIQKRLSNKEQPASKERVDVIVNDIIAKTKERNTGESTSPDQILDNTLAYLQGSKFYEEATDVEREAAVRELNDKLGIKIKKAPSVAKISGKVINKVTVNEYVALKDQIRLEARAARESKADQTTRRKSINTVIKDFASKGKISLAQTKAVVAKLSGVNLNNDTKVDEFIAYTEKVFNNAEYAVKLGKANSLHAQTKKNINTGVLGVNSNVLNPIRALLSIPTNTIENIDSYIEFLETVGKKLKNFKVPADTATRATELYDELYLEPEEIVEPTEAEVKRTKTVVEDINKAETTGEDLVDSHGDFILKNINKLDSVTLKNLADKVSGMKDSDVADNIIAEAKKRNELIKDIKNKKVKLKEIDAMSRNDASFYKTLTGEDIISLTGKELNDLDIITDNINNGIFNHSAFKMSELIGANRQTKIVAPLLKRVDATKIAMGFTRLYGKVKTLVTKKGAIVESIRGNNLDVIDDVLGNFKGREISNEIFNALARPMAAYDEAISQVISKADKVNELLAATFKESVNAEVKRKVRVHAYGLTKESESNKNNKGVATGVDFLKKSVEKHEDDPVASNRTNEDIKIFKEVIKEYEGNTAEEIFNTLTENEKKAASIIEQAYNENTEKAYYAATIIRGEYFESVDNYMHHNVVMNEADRKKDIMDNTNNLLTPSTRSKVAIGRTGGAKAISFDPGKALIRSSRYTLLDYKMTSPIRQNRIALNKIREASKAGTELQLETANALISVHNEVLENVLSNNFSDYSVFTKGLDKASRIAYRAMLSSLPRALAETESNIGYVALAAPKEFKTGITKYANLIFGSRGRIVAEILNSKVLDKLWSEKGELTGTRVESGSVLRGKSSSKKARGKIGQGLEYLSRPLGRAYDAAQAIDGLIISTPDKAISRPLWFGSLDFKFKQETGVDLDIDKIMAGDQAYLIDNKQALFNAVSYADMQVTRAATSNSKINVVLKNAPKASDGGWRASYKRVNSLMANFSLTEHATARQAVISMMGAGEMSRARGLATLSAIGVRSALYFKVSAGASAVAYGAVLSLMGIDTEEEEEDKTLNDHAIELGKGMVSAGVNLLSRRNLGNLPDIPINMYIEHMNEKNGAFLRDGKEYNKYEDSFVYNVSSVDKIKRNWKEEGAKIATSPYSPFVKSIDKVIRESSKTIKSVNDRKALEEYAKLRNLNIIDTGKKPPSYLDLINAQNITDAFLFTGMIPIYRDVSKIITKSKAPK